MVYCNDCDKEIYSDYDYMMFSTKDAATDHHNKTGHEVIYETHRYTVIPRSGNDSE